MLKLKLFYCFAALIALSACGSNPDYGKTYGKKSTTSTAASTTPSGGQSNNTFGPCKTLAIYGGSNPAVAAEFSGSSACASTSDLSVVRVKVSAYFSTTARVCAVPSNFSSVFQGTCFTINGQADIQLSTPSFTAVALVYETHLASYLSYMNGQSSSYPPMALATLR